MIFAGLLVARHLRGAPTSHGAPPAPAAVQLSVAFARCAFFDPSRPTEDYVTRTSTPGRRIVSDIYYPAYELATGGRARPGELTPAERAPHPTVFFVGGYDVDPSRYVALLTSWVRTGIVVVALEPPDANEAAVAKSGGSFADEADIPNQPADVAFATRRVLADSAGHASGCRALRGLVDPSEIGLAGQSDGATTVAMLAYDQGSAPGGATSYPSLAAGLHYRAVAAMSGSAYGDDPYAAPAGSPSLLVVQSATDTCNTPLQSVDLYSALPVPQRWFLGLRHARHLTPYEGQAAAAFGVVAKVTSAFLAGELRGKDPGAALLVAGNADPAVAALTSGASVPPFVEVPATQSAASCYAT
ncbi:MAG TPA: hypothetical protein VMV02_07575 [Acidimicrobiales bacterium]|nr:hypothetical protein [Acidimicrobiales bacterium]